MPLDQFRIDDKVALITGGNRGIGLAIAKVFQEAGARSMITGRKLTSEVEALVDAHPQSVGWVQADMKEAAAPARLVAETVARFGRLDILVNNAGVADNGNFHEFDDARLANVMDTNFTGPFRLAREAVKVLLEQGGGTIVNVGSISAEVANTPQLQVAYNASKAAVHQMTRVMAFEYASRGIRVNAVAPGYIISDMTAGGIANEEWNRIWTRNTPMGRFGQPEEVANCALFLCSPAASFVTGSILVADGGYLTH